MDGVATGYGLDGQVSILGRGTRFFSTQRRPDGLWGPPNFPSNGYLGLLPGGKVAEAWRWPVTSI
jgi:hypothetical protein